MLVKAMAALLVLTSSACLPVLVGGLILKSSKSNAEKREFITQLQNTNMDRERLGLKPLDACSEKYKFDPGWAAQDPVCLERIKRYRAGDQSALDMGATGPAVAPTSHDTTVTPTPPAAPNPPLDAAFSPSYGMTCQAILGPARWRSGAAATVDHSDIRGSPRKGAGMVMSRRELPRTSVARSA